jgi:hypothetical protein
MNNLSNFEAIGIHIGRTHYNNKGTLLKNAVKKFLNKFG